MKYSEANTCLGVGVCLFTDDQNIVDEHLYVYDGMLQKLTITTACVWRRAPEIVDLHKVDGKSARVKAPWGIVFMSLLKVTVA